MADEKTVAPEIKRKASRLLFLTVSLLVWSLILIIRLVQVQVVDHAEYEHMAKRQYERRVKVEAERGTIYDRNKNKLVVNLINYSFAADPHMMAERHKPILSAQMARLFQKPNVDYQAKLQKNTSFVWLERRVPQSLADRVPDSIRGLIRLQSLRRQYPYSAAAGQLLGFTDIDQKGLSGIEQSLDDELAGRDGWAILQADALGRLHPSPDYPHEDPIHGNHVTLTIDAYYQSVAYTELTKTVDEYRADDGMVIIMNPRTGEILAMAYAPGFDPAFPEKASPAVFRNRAITDMYEPGSTFKAITAAAALEEGVVQPDELLNCENGVLTIYGHRIHDSKKHGTLSFAQVVSKSSNIGTIKVAQRLGPDRLFQYVRAFGFGTETGVDLEGEIPGDLKFPTDWSGLSLPMISIGQEVGVTALQLANAYGAIANGGTLMRPYIVRTVESPDGTILLQNEPRVIRTVASRAAMTKVASMLEGVVETGTGRRASIEGVHMAGKTGTAQKIENGKYATDKFTASFVGFFPANQPQLVFLVIVNNPRKSIWGEVSAAVTARSIVEKIINSGDDYARQIHRAMAAAEPQESPIQDIPNLAYLTVEAATNVLHKLAIDFDVVGEGDMVVGQEWTGDAGQRRVILRTTTSLQESEMGEANLSKDKQSRRVPDVRGLSVRMAINKMHAEGLDVKVRGSGFVMNQLPAPGSRLPEGTACVLHCRTSL